MACCANSHGGLYLHSSFNLHVIDAAGAEEFV